MHFGVVSLVGADKARSPAFTEIISQATDAISHTRSQPCVDIQATRQGPVHAWQALATYDKYLYIWFWLCWNSNTSWMTSSLMVLRGLWSGTEAEPSLQAWDEAGVWTPNLWKAWMYTTKITEHLPEPEMGYHRTRNSSCLSNGFWVNTGTWMPANQLLSQPHTMVDESGTLFMIYTTLIVFHLTAEKLDSDCESNDVWPKSYHCSETIIHDVFGGCYQKRFCNVLLFTV
jgi:hypothetical protein